MTDFTAPAANAPDPFHQRMTVTYDSGNEVDFEYVGDVTPQGGFLIYRRPDGKIHMISAAEISEVVLH